MTYLYEKYIKIALVIITISGLVGCGGNDGGNNATNQPADPNQIVKEPEKTETKTLEKPKEEEAAKKAMAKKMAEERKKAEEEEAKKREEERKKAEEEEAKKTVKEIALPDATQGIFYDENLDEKLDVGAITLLDNLPAGLSIDYKTRHIYGTPSASPAEYNLYVKTTNTDKTKYHKISFKINNFEINGIDKSELQKLYDKFKKEIADNKKRGSGYYEYPI